MPYPLRLRPSHRVPSGLHLPGATILPLVYQVGSAMLLTIWYTPVGLGDFGAPTAVSKTRTVRTPSRTASLRSAMLTTIRRAGRVEVSCARASAAAISITPVSAAIFLI